MAYNDGIKLTAYTLYLQGLTYEEVARKTRSVHKLKTLKGQTVEAWAEAGKWEAKRDEVRNQVRKHHEHEAAGLLGELHLKSETILESLYAQLTAASAPKISSYEGAVYAFKGISEFLLALDKRKGESIQPIMVVQTLLEVLQNIPSVRNEIKKNWPKIQKEISARIGLPTGEPQKVIDVTPKDKES